MHLSKKEVRQEQQGACMNEQGTPGQTPAKKEAHRECKQGLVAWEEYKETG